MERRAPRQQEVQPLSAAASVHGEARFRSRRVYFPWLRSAGHRECYYSKIKPSSPAKFLPREGGTERGLFFCRALGLARTRTRGRVRAGPGTAAFPAARVPRAAAVSPHGKRDCGPRTSPAPTGYSRGCGCPWSPGSARDGRACSGSGWCPAATPRLGVFLLGAGGLPSHSAEVTHLGPERVNTVSAAPSSPSAFLRPRRRVSCVVKASGTASAPRERRRLPGVPPPRPGRAPVHSDQPRAARSCLNDRLRSVPRKRLHVL